MRTGLQHFAFRDVIARIRSLEDVSPEAWCSHGPGADRRFLSFLPCQTSVSVKQQLAADSEAEQLAWPPGTAAGEGSMQPWYQPGQQYASPIVPQHCLSPQEEAKRVGFSELLMERQEIPQFLILLLSLCLPGCWERRPLLECRSIPSNAASQALQPCT